MSQTFAQLQAIRVFEATGHRIHPDSAQRDAMQHKMAATWSEPGSRWRHGKCIVCGCDMPADEVQIEALEATIEAVAAVCDACEEIVEDSYQSGGRAICGATSPTPRWDVECPILFRRIIDGTINPPIDRSAMEKVLRWDLNSRGLILIGESGSGKTSTLWALFRNLERDGISPQLWTAVDMARELSKYAKNLEEAKHLWNCGVLMVDDLGKETITPAASALFWELVDRRYSAQLPIIITTRFTGNDFAERFREPTLGGDIRRRLKDMCKTVLFEKQPTQD